MDAIWIEIIEVLAIVYLVWERFKRKKQYPSLKTGQRVSIIEKDHSNITVTREGDRVIFLDEDNKELKIKDVVK